MAPLLLFLSTASACQRSPLDETRKEGGVRGYLGRFLMDGLVYEHPVPRGGSRNPSGTGAYIYVLGGNQDSLAVRFEEAARLYRKGIAEKILILHRPGITEFSPDVGRNLTNDEWATRELGIFNVRGDDVIPVPVKTGLFGTLSEAGGVTEYLRGKGCRRLVLVSSGYHTRRAFLAFSVFTANRIPGLYIYGSMDRPGFAELLEEHTKLFFYEYFAIPAIRLLGVGGGETANKRARIWN